MDPQIAIDEFNSSGTCRAERVDLAEGLLNWLISGGFCPTGELDQCHIDSLKAHGEIKGALDATRVNEILVKIVVCKST